MTTQTHSYRPAGTVTAAGRSGLQWLPSNGPSSTRVSASVTVQTANRDSGGEGHGSSPSRRPPAAVNQPARITWVRASRGPSELRSESFTGLGLRRRGRCESETCIFTVIGRPAPPRAGPAAWLCRVGVVDHLVTRPSLVYTKNIHKYKYIHVYIGGGHVVDMCILGLTCVYNLAGG